MPTQSSNKSGTLEPLFSPRSVAVVGASQDTKRIRCRLLRQLLDGGFAGPVYPVNPSSDLIQGLKAYPSVEALPEAVDLALIAVAADQIMEVLAQCAKRGIRAAAIFTAGANGVPVGQRLQDHVAAFARESGMRILGPNAEGFIDTEGGLLATFSPTLIHVPPLPVGALPRRGRVSIVSQSGAMAFALYSRAMKDHVPIRHLVSTGNESDVELLEVVDHLIAQASSRVILLFVEGFRDPQRFAGVASRAADAGVALVVAKIGRSSAGQRAAVSHTAHLTGADTAYDAAFERYGVIRVDTPDEMLAIAAAISAGSYPKGKRVAIITTSGGAGGWAADICEQAGLEVPEFVPEFKRRLAEIVPDYGSAENPVDVTARVVEDGGRTLLGILDLLETAPGIDMGLVIMSLVASERITGIETELAGLHAKLARPLVFHSPGVAGAEALSALARVGGLQLGLPQFARAMCALDNYRLFRVRWLEQRKASAPALTIPPSAPALHEGVIDGKTTRALLDAWKVPQPGEQIVRGVDEAVAAAQSVGWPVAIKIVSPDIAHKTEAGGVELGLQNAEEVRAASERILERVRSRMPGARIEGLQVQQMMPPGREMVVGVVRDPDFGPMVMLGLGGIYIEVLRDAVFALAPLSLDDAHGMIGRLKGRAILEGVRGEPAADIGALAELLVSVSRMAAAHANDIAEIDLNPVLLYPVGRGAVAVDALVVAGSPAVRESH
ncbi:MAG: acetate--CoA ligase family protein [Comamonadaceae bacterium]|nr:acetate--CoA ligase family protein [Comamonadaceae bacterium]